MTAAAMLDWDMRVTPRVLRLAGDWVLAQDQALGRQIARLGPELDAAALEDSGIDDSALGELDTAGAARLVELLGQERLERWLKESSSLPPARVALLRTVAHAVAAAPPAAPARRPSVLHEVLGRVGLAMISLGGRITDLLGFAGLTLATLAASCWRPSRWRLTSVVAQIEETALNAVPIVALLTFMVGAVVAFLGATVLADFGASLYTVDLVGFSFLREFAVLLTAILVAGRTASAFTAQLGSMKVNEEIDALRVQGMDPMELLVLPRVIALLVALPILTLVGMLAGLAGGAAVCALSLDIPTSMFFSMLRQDMELRHFFVGMGKAPVFAFLIALIGCREGFKVSGSAQSVGEHTTSSVVQSIFVVILLDALAALFFMEMGW